MLVLEVLTFICALPMALTSPMKSQTALSGVSKVTPADTGDVGQKLVCQKFYIKEISLGRNFPKTKSNLIIWKNVRRKVRNLVLILEYKLLMLEICRKCRH